MTRFPPPPEADSEPVSAWDRVGVALVALCAALAALFETLLVPLYVGSALVPVAVVLALMSNVVLPKMARTLVPTTLAALAPFGAWLVVVLGFGTIGRPEGDVILPGAPSSLEFVTYGVLLGGALAGTVTVVWLSPPPAKR
ncbi:MAG TPA: hypothetical protein VE442_26475 [Jatrophihabitans sp.]|jgi:hypothetical protein|nr:hypothetical protein [Jatrophihabitans sp.]